MSVILELLKKRSATDFGPGDWIIRQGETTGRLYFLVEGSVEVLKDGVRLATASQPAAVFGEMAMLLRGPHTASVRGISEGKYCTVDDPREFLASSPAVCMHICDLLAHRLDALNCYLIDVKGQYEGHDHLGMVDGILDTLLHRPSREVVRPRTSTIPGDELPE
jgi:CRP-like cAMP-binding protein